MYGTRCFVNETIGNFLLFGTGYHYIRDGPYSFMAHFFFLSIRIHLGGYHAPYHWLCLVISTFVGISSIFLTGFGIQ
ncbi:MAG: accessory gene regulator B family protein [Clostridium sp.]